MMTENQQAHQDGPAAAARPQSPPDSTRRQESDSYKNDSYDSGIGRLLDREPPAEYRREWTERVAAAQSALEPGTRSVVIFRIGSEWLALPTQIIREVVEKCRIHSIPHHRNGVLMGLASVRGNLIACASLSTVLGLRENGRAESTDEPTGDRSAGGGRLLIIDHRAGLLTIPVDEVGGVHRYHPRDLKELPATLSHAAATYTSGILLWQQKAVGCLDDELILYTLNKGLI
jgi:chemotaxis-related protein WspD